MSQFKHLIIDGNNLIIRCAFSLMDPMIGGNPRKEIGATHVFLKSLKSNCDEHKPNKVWIAWDIATNKYRKNIQSTYKGNRNKTNPQYLDAINQIQGVTELTTLLGVTNLSHTELEADDIIAWLVNEHPNDEIIISSTDNDMAQLMTRKSPIIVTAKNRTITKSNFEEKFGVTPEKFLYWKALQGDNSDNIEGIPGVGPKKATSIVNQTKNEEEIKTLLTEKEKKDKEKHCILRNYIEIFNENLKMLELKLWDKSNEPNAPKKEVWDQIYQNATAANIQDLDLFNATAEKTGLRLILNQMPSWADSIIGRESNQKTLL